MTTCCHPERSEGSLDLSVATLLQDDATRQFYPPAKADNDWPTGYRKILKSIGQYDSKQVALVIGGHGIFIFTFYISYGLIKIKP
ncbi:hypothetical protein KJ866_01880 [Patescibacteria group bacterium]|nr:hypothetical protein [Patescibacteria group bacterium]